MTGRPVLVADEGNPQSRSALAAVRALGRAGYPVLVTSAGQPSLASRSRWCSGTLVVEPGCGAAFAQTVADLLAAGEVQAVLPSSDLAVQALASPGAELLDKRTLGERAAAAGIPVPAGRELPSWTALEQLDDLAFPLVVKPAARRPGTTGSAVLVRDRGELERAAEVAGPLVLQPFLPGTMSAVAGVVAGGRLLAAVHQAYLRTWPADCGVASAAVTVPPDVQREEALLRLLAGFTGIFQAQFVGDALIDLNPRVYGSMPLALAAGVNLPAVLLRADEGQEMPLLRARTGVHYRWTEGDLRHLRQAVVARSMSCRAAGRALRPHRAAAHSVGARDDLRPLLQRAQHVLRRLA